MFAIPSDYSMIDACRSDLLSSHQRYHDAALKIRASRNAHIVTITLILKDLQ
jgi:hypothetical protein